MWLDDELMRTYAGRESPGPNNYQYPPGLGKQNDSKYPTAPGWKQGTSTRWKGTAMGHETPGPNTYGIKDALGPQVLSSKKTLPACKIGTGSRDAFKKVRAHAARRRAEGGHRAA